MSVGKSNTDKWIDDKFNHPTIVFHHSQLQKLTMRSGGGTSGNTSGKVSFMCRGCGNDTSLLWSMSSRVFVHVFIGKGSKQPVSH